MSTLPSDTPVARRSNRRFWLLGIIVAVAALGVGAIFKLYDLADLSEYDTSPLPRPKINAPFITTPDNVTDQMVELADIQASDLVYDLGCGDGRLVITAAMQRGSRGIGIDIEAKRVAEAIENAKQHGVEHLVTIREQDVFEVDLSDADVIMMYLLPWMLRDLKPSFEKCRPGTRLVSHDFEIEGILADKVIEVPVSENERHYVRLYVTPLKKAPEQKPRKRTL